MSKTAGQLIAAVATLGLLYSALIYIKNDRRGAAVGRLTLRALPDARAEGWPLVINTWSFTNATGEAYSVLSGGGSALSAVEAGCSTCEVQRCDGTVGWGGSPDEDGETTLDAMIMDGSTHDVGAVGALRGIKSAISVARHVMDYTRHTLLVGSQATQFALEMGFQLENLTSPESVKIYEDWRTDDCQPNFWENVVPSPESACGPYSPANLRTTDEMSSPPDQQDLEIQDRGPISSNTESSSQSTFKTIADHDTIGMVAIDVDGRISCGTSSNGAKHKIPGRVGDAPIAGSGCYVDRDVGGAAATGDGDIMMRFLPTLVAVEAIKLGLNPTEAATVALLKIVEFYPEFEGGIVAASIGGDYGAACHGFSGFQMSIGSPQLENIEIVNVPCTYSNSPT